MRAILDMSERDLQSHVVEACRAMNLFHYHTHDSRRSPAGFPDLVIVGPAGVLFRELKANAGVLSAEQTDVLGRLRRAGADAAVWRPLDWASGVVIAQLMALRRTG
jgi:hypothetical protein